jgi:hypothetical protein
MYEAELRRVQGKPWSAAVVWDHTTIGPAIVNGFTADGMPSLREMNANLVRASRFELAHEDRVTRQFLEHVDMRDGVLAGRL